MLKEEHRMQIERALGRELSPAELAAAARPEEMSAAVLHVARVLRSRSLVLCAIYVNKMASLRGVELNSFVGELEPELEL